MNKPRVWFFACILICVFTGGCNEAVVSAAKSVVSMTPAKVWIEKVQFSIDDTMNDNAPAAIHLIVVYKPELFDSLSKMPAEDYFSKLDQLKRDNPGMIDFFIWEAAPGQAKGEQNVVPTRVDGAGAIVFARYKTPGDHRSVLSGEKQLRIVLDKEDFHTEKIS